MLYRTFRALSSVLDEELVHHSTLKLLKYIPSSYFLRPMHSPVKVMGLTFSHRIGLAGGFDKSGQYAGSLAKLGFSFAEFGTVTPKPQPGNEKPRLFRVPHLQALINRMGFNNEGVDALVNMLKAGRFNGIQGISIGPNKTTPKAKILDDYTYGLQKAYPIADYIAVNISSPNTPGLREMQHIDSLKVLVTHLEAVRQKLIDVHEKYVPIVVKLSPDESDESLKRMVEVLLHAKVDGMILTNTTVHREVLKNTKYAAVLGGLSGKPLAHRAMECLTLAKAVVGDDLALIASGGIYDAKEAKARLLAGADLVQLYTGLVYQGPGLVADCAKAAITA